MYLTTLFMTGCRIFLIFVTPCHPTSPLSSNTLIQIGFACRIKCHELYPRIRATCEQHVVIKTARYEMLQDTSNFDGFCSWTLITVECIVPML